MIKLLFILIFIFPVIFIPVEIFYYYNIIDYKLISLTVSNLFAIIPFSSSFYYTFTKQQNMILQVIPFYFIIFTSSTYHLCQDINISMYCILPNKIYAYIDYINSYFCISSVILYNTKIKNSYDVNKTRLFIYICQLLLVMLINIETTSENINISLNIIIAVFPLIISILYHENYFNYNIYYLVLGLLFGFTGSITYLLIYYKIIETNNYWVYHSFMWHLMMFISAFFLFESHIYERSFIEYCKEMFTYTLKKSNVEIEIII